MSTRTEVLAALKEAGEAGVSGQSLALCLGISRAAVAKHVSALREAGYTVHAAAGTGYRLDAAPDLPLPDEVAALVRSAMWTPLLGGGATGSTNDDAKTLARSGAVAGTVVLAARQEAGRGRMGRQWVSPEGGVYLSFVLRPEAAPSELGWLPLAVAVGVARGLDELGVSTALKWPNDVLLAGDLSRGDAQAHGKLAGILLEMSAEADRTEWVVVGVGVNVRPAAGARVPGAAYLSDVIEDPGLARVAATVLDGVASAIGVSWPPADLDDLRAEYASHSLLDGCAVDVYDTGGSVRVSGTVRGVDGEGRLVVVRSDGDRVALSSGDVTLRSR